MLDWYKGKSQSKLKKKYIYILFESSKDFFKYRKYVLPIRVSSIQNNYFGCYLNNYTFRYLENSVIQEKFSPRVMNTCNKSLYYWHNIYTIWKNRYVKIA